MAGGKKTFTYLKDKTVRIIGVSTGKNSLGKTIYIYTDLFGPVWANYRSLSGSEYYYFSNRPEVCSRLYLRLIGAQG